MMESMILHRTLARRTRELVVWQQAAIGLLILSVLWNVGLTMRIDYLEAARRDAEAQRIQAELACGSAREQMENMVSQMEQERQERAAQAAAYEALGAYRYIGECVITAYCPCAECCGQWADGLTATGIPAVPGIVAVDPEVIPLGSVVVIDGQRYLAADTGVRGLSVDVCMSGHDETVVFGMQTAEVWIEAEGG